MYSRFNNPTVEMLQNKLADIEGAEYECLKNFDFTQFKWRFLTVERPNLKLNLLLDKNGYIQVNHYNYDTFYVHKDYISFLDKEPFNSQFLLTPKKDW